MVTETCLNVNLFFFLIEEEVFKCTVYAALLYGRFIIEQAVMSMKCTIKVTWLSLTDGHIDVPHCVVTLMSLTDGHIDVPHCVVTLMSLTVWSH